MESAAKQARVVSNLMKESEDGFHLRLLVLPAQIKLMCFFLSLFFSFAHKSDKEVMLFKAKSSSQKGSKFQKQLQFHNKDNSRSSVDLV